MTGQKNISNYFIFTPQKKTIYTMSSQLVPCYSDVSALGHRGYRIGRKIGQGSYATVHIAEYTHEKGARKTRLACKIFDKDKAPKDFLEKFFPRELEILTKLDNPNIIQVHSILQRGPRVFIFMRHAETGDLLDYIKRKGNIPEQQCRVWFRQMANGLQYLHSKNIAHRDLKCENILISKNMNVKLADFGFARYSVDKDGLKILSRTYCGSAAYAAPEVVSGTPYNPKLADVWSLGVILFIMLNGSMPFDDSNLKTLLRAQRNKKYDFCRRVKDKLSSTVKSLVPSILEPDVMERVTLDRLLAHEWVKGHHKNKSSAVPEEIGESSFVGSSKVEETGNQEPFSSGTATAHSSLRPVEERHSMLIPERNHQNMVKVEDH